MKARDVIAKLEAAGFVRTEGGNHIKLAHPDGRWTILSRGLREVPPVFVRRMEKQTGVRLLD